MHRQLRKHRRRLDSVDSCLSTACNRVGMVQWQGYYKADSTGSYDLKFIHGGKNNWCYCGTRDPRMQQNGQCVARLRDRCKFCSDSNVHRLPSGVLAGFKRADELQACEAGMYEDEEGRIIT